MRFNFIKVTDTLYFRIDEGKAVLSNKIVIICIIPECLGQNEKIKKVKTLMSDLKQQKIPKVLSPENIRTYTIDWTEKGETLFV